MTTPHHAAAPRPGAQAVLAAIFLTTVMMGLGSTMLNIAVPVISDHFSASTTEATAMVIANGLVNVMLLIPAGQIADKLDRRRVFIFGLAFFTVLSLLLGFSPNPLFLAIGRGLQGAASAILLSNAVAILAMVFPPGHLPRALGVYMAGLALGQVGGPLVGGLIASTIGWQWLFWGNVPIGVAAVLLGARALSKVPAPAPNAAPLDVPGAVLIGAFMAGTQLLLALAAGAGFGNPWILSGFAACLLLLPLLVVVERRVRNPVFAGDLMRNAVLTWGLVQSFLVLLPRFAVLTLASLYLQGVRGDSVAIAALKVAPCAAGMTVGSLLASWLSKPLGHRKTMVISAALSAAAVAAMWANVGWNSQAVTIASLTVIGFGNGVFQTLNSAIITTSTPPARTGVVNSIRVTVATFSSVLGLALAMALIVAWAPESVAAAFLSGNPDALGAGRALIDRGYSITYALMFVVIAVGTITSLANPKATPGDRTVGA